MAFQGRLRVPQWSIFNQPLLAETITYNQYGVETARVVTDLTGAIVYFTVRDESDVIVIQKDSTNVAEIEIAAPATSGQATLKFVYADTAPLSNDPTTQYWFDFWVKTAAGIEEPIVKRGRFYVDESVTHIALGPAPSLPTYPAAQTEQARSFKWTAPSTGDLFTVTIPGTGMLDTVYTIAPGYATIPIGGSWAALYMPEASRTTTTFVLETSSPIIIGTVIDFLLRDVA